MANAIRKFAEASIVWIGAILGLFIAYPLVDSILGALTDIPPVLTAIMWVSFIILIILAIVFIPIARITSE